MNRKIAVLVGSVLLLGAFSLPASARVDVGINIGVPPPPAQVEVVPVARPGYVWAPGYWAWGPGGQHVWVGGRYIVERPGYVWVGERWDRRGEFHHFEPGHWERGHYDRYHR